MKRYEAYKREIDGIKDFHLYVETITSDDYHDFEEYIQNEHELFKEYADFYSQFGLKGVSVPKPMAIVSITFMIRHLRTIHHLWYNKNGDCQESCYRSSRAFARYREIDMEMKRGLVEMID